LSLSIVMRKPAGMSGGSPVLQAGHGMPAPPQVHARGPSHGRSS
jgi:hypothetical protein